MYDAIGLIDLIEDECIDGEARNRLKRALKGYLFGKHTVHQSPARDTPVSGVGKGTTGVKAASGATQVDSRDASPVLTSTSKLATQVPSPDGSDKSYPEPTSPSQPISVLAPAPVGGDNAAALAPAPVGGDNAAALAPAPVGGDNAAALAPAPVGGDNAPALAPVGGDNAPALAPVGRDNAAALAPAPVGGDNAPALAPVGGDNAVVIAPAPVEADAAGGMEGDDRNSSARVLQQVIDAAQRETGRKRAIAEESYEITTRFARAKLESDTRANQRKRAETVLMLVDKLVQVRTVAGLTDEDRSIAAGHVHTLLRDTCQP